MVTISIESEKLLEIVSERASKLHLDRDGSKSRCVILGVKAIIEKYQGSSETFGLEPGKNWVSISYHLLMGELLIVLRNAWVEHEEEWVLLSGLDRNFQEFLDIEPYL